MNLSKFIILVLLLLLFITDLPLLCGQSTYQSTYQIDTVAGYRFYDGNGGLAKLVPVEPVKVAVNNNTGEIFFINDYPDLIRKINETSGVITTVAGTLSSSATDKDGQLATNTPVSRSFGIAVSSSGEVYFSELYRHRVRKVDVDGFIWTVAGNGVAGFSGDGGDAKSARLSSPQCLAITFDDELLICDNGNSRIRKVNLQSGIISTIAGNGTNGISEDNIHAINATLNSLVGICSNDRGDIFVADIYRDFSDPQSRDISRIVKIDVDGIITTMFSSQDSRTRGLAIYSNGSLLFSESGRI